MIKVRTSIFFKRIYSLDCYGWVLYVVLDCSDVGGRGAVISCGSSNLHLFGGVTSDSGLLPDKHEDKKILAFVLWHHHATTHKHDNK